MSTELQTGRVRLSIAATDRRLASAVATRFLEWWDAVGHIDLVMPADIEPRPDVSWNSNTASITLPVQFTTASEPASSSSRTDRTAEIAPNGSFVEFHALARKTPVGDGGRDWTFEVVDDLPDTDLMFPSETASRRALDRIRRWRRRKNPVTRVTSRAAATTAIGARGMRRGLQFIVGPRPLVRAAAVSVMLASAITVSIGLPNRILSAARDTRAADSAAAAPRLRQDKPVAATIEKPAVRVAAPIANAPVPSRSLVMLKGPARISPSRRATTYIRTARASIRRNQLASLAAQRKSQLALAAAERKKEQALLAAQRKNALALTAAQRKTEARSRTAPKQQLVASAAVAPKPSAAPKTPPSEPKATATTGTEYTGSLLVVSEPSGAAVKIDGQAMGTTPLQIDRIRVGSHAIHVSLDGYPVWSRSATVVYGKSNGVVAQLVK